MEKMRIAFAGAGAVGSVYAAILHSAGHQVYLLARGKHLSAIKKKGLTVVFPDKTITFRPEKSGEKPDGWGEMDVVFVTVKSYDTEKIVDTIEPLVGEKTLVVTIQNGIGNEEIIAKKYGVERTVGGITLIGAEMVSPGKVRCYAPGRITLGTLDGKKREAVEKLIEALNSAGIETRFTENLMEVKWKKLLWNAVYNPLTAITMLSVDEILTDSMGKKLAEKALQEVVSVAEALGYRMPSHAIEKNLRPIGDRFPGFKTSMLQDRLRGKPLEYEAILGPVVHNAHRLGLDVPVCETMYIILHLMEMKRKNEKKTRKIYEGGDEMEKDVETVEVAVGNKKLVIKKGDITEEDVDAVVNAANSRLAGGGGVDGAIHRVGGPEIMKECREIIKRIGRLEPGKSIITTGGKLPAKYVIHTVGPVWRGGGHSEEETLRNCYLNSLRIAEEKHLRTIAFPAISTGAYRFPVEKAAKIAVTTTYEYLRNAKKDCPVVEIRHVLFDRKTFESFRTTALRVS